MPLQRCIRLVHFLFLILKPVFWALNIRRGVTHKPDEKDRVDFSYISATASCFSLKSPDGHVSSFSFTTNVAASSSSVFDLFTSFASFGLPRSYREIPVQSVTMDSIMYLVICNIVREFKKIDFLRMSQFVLKYWEKKRRIKRRDCPQGHFQQNILLIYRLQPHDKC